MKSTPRKEIAVLFILLFTVVFTALALLLVSWLSGFIDNIPYAVTGIALLVTALGVTAFTARYVAVKVFGPIARIGKVADSIARNASEAEIGVFTDADDEINSMTRSLHKMVEQFRAREADIEKMCKEVGLKRRIGEITASAEIGEVFGKLTSLLCEFFGVFKVTAVYYNDGKYKAFSDTVSEHPITGKKEESKMFYFEQFDRLKELLRSRRIAFLNRHTIAAQNIGFLEAVTDSACFVPLRNKDMFGCVIFESSGNQMPLSEELESLMRFVGETLSEYLCDKEWSADSVKHEQGAGIAEKLKSIEYLDVDSALDAVGGLRDVYEQSVNVTVRLLPETVKKMDTYLAESDINKFAVEVHGIKSVLRNIGANTLGSMAAWLENAAKSGETDYCNENYPHFKELLLKFEEEARAVIASEVKESKGEMDGEELIETIKKAAEAAESYDAVAALDSVRPLSDYTFGKETEETVKKIIFALEEFNCEGALKEMEVLLNGGA